MHERVKENVKNSEHINQHITTNPSSVVNIAEIVNLDLVTFARTFHGKYVPPRKENVPVR
jgi:hypothetical protein